MQSKDATTDDPDAGTHNRCGCGCRVTGQQITVEAFAAPAAASDLRLGTGLRVLEDTTVRSGEIRKGGVAVQTSGEPVLTPQAAKLGYYLELYPARAETLTVSLRVL